MSAARVGVSAAFLFAMLIVQESLISRIQFPITGFSLYLAVLVTLISLEDRSGAIVMGFLGGIVLDLSPSSDAPFGQWALIFTVIGYLFAANRESVGDFTSQPFIFVLFVALSAGLSLGIYLIVGLILGENNGSFQRDLIIIAGNFLWTLLFAPIFLPAIGKVRRVSLSARERA